MTSRLSYGERPTFGLFLLLVLACVLAPILAFAQAAAVGPSQPVGTDWTQVLTGVIGLLTLIIGAYLRNKGANENTINATQLMLNAAGIAVRAGYLTYTEEVKAASADGELTEIEKATARDRAFKAALAALGDRGVKLLKDGFGAGWEAALRTNLEAAYADFQGGPTRTTAVASPAAALPPR